MRALFIWQLQLPLTVPAAVTVSDSLSYSLSLYLSGLASCPSPVTVTVNVAIHIKIIVCRRTFITRNGSPGSPGNPAGGAAADFCLRFDCHKMILKMQFGQKCARLLPRSLGLSNGIATLSATSLSSPSPLLLPLKRYALGNTHLQIAFPTGCPVSSP